jgi:hypothetical protein
MDELNKETTKLVKLEPDSMLNYEDESQTPTLLKFHNSPPSATLLNSLSPSSSPSLANTSKFNQINGNKITLVPLNNSTSGNMLPIKRVVQVNTNTNSPSSTFLGTSPNRALNTTALNTNNLAEKSSINNKIFTSINTNSISNSNTSATNANNSGNSKIHVKIVNMASLNNPISTNNNNNTIMNSSPILNKISNVNNTASNVSTPTAFKITTISANNNSGATNLQVN